MSVADINPKKVTVNLLLVESNEATRLFFSDIFWLHSLDSKFDFFVADGVDAAEKFLTDTAHLPDLVFVDLVMTQVGDNGLIKTSPEVGLDFISRIKNDPLLKKTKVIVYASYPEKQYGDAARKRGADMYIYKSENLPQDILNVLKQLHVQHMEALAASAH